MSGFVARPLSDPDEPKMSPVERDALCRIYRALVRISGQTMMVNVRGRRGFGGRMVRASLKSLAMTDKIEASKMR